MQLARLNKTLGLDARVRAEAPSPPHGPGFQDTILDPVFDGPAPDVPEPEPPSPAPHPPPRPAQASDYADLGGRHPDGPWRGSG